MKKTESIKTTLRQWIAAGQFTAILAACTAAIPEQQFAKAVLNSNLITVHYSPRYWDAILQLKDGNRLVLHEAGGARQVTASEYLGTRLPDLDANISDIRSLERTADNGEMLDAALALFEEANGIFKDDYPKIARMIDENRPRAEIEAAIDAVFATLDPSKQAKTERLRAAALPFARTHGLDVRL